MMLTSVEPENTELKRVESVSRVWNGIHDHESKSSCESVSDDAHHTTPEAEMVEIAKMDDTCRKESVGVINYEIVEKLSSDPCLTVRIAVKKEKPPVNISEKEKSPVNISEKEKPPVNISEKEKQPVNISGKLKQPVDISEKEKLPVDISEKEKLPVNISEKEKPPVNISEKEKPPVSVPERENNCSVINVNENDKQIINSSDRDVPPVDVSGKDNPKVQVSDEDKSPVNISDNGAVVEDVILKEDKELVDHKFIPGLWRPNKRRKRNLLRGNRKKSWRLECMVPGCSTRAYSSKFVDFPDEVERRIEWASKSKLSEKFPGVNPEETLPKRIGLCMAHFKEDDFNIISRGDSKVCKLKDMASPSLFPWVGAPSNISSGMDIFDRTRFSRELRLLAIMKAELHHMMNPPYKVNEGIEEDSQGLQHLPQNDGKTCVRREDSHLPSRDVGKNFISGEISSKNSDKKCVPNKSDWSSKTVEENCIHDEVPQHPSNQAENSCIRNFPRRCKTKDPNSVSNQIEYFSSSNPATKDNESCETPQNHIRRSSRIRISHNYVGNFCYETPQPLFKSSKKTVHNTSKRVKSKVSLKSEQNIKNVSNHKTPQEHVKQNCDIQERFPRKCKFRMPYIFHQDIYGNNRSFSSSHKSYSKTRNDKKHATNRVIYHEIQNKKQPETNIFIDDQLYDIKIENCEDEMIGVDCSSRETDADLRADEQMFDHFLAPYSDPTCTEAKHQEINNCSVPPFSNPACSEMPHRVFRDSATPHSNPACTATQHQEIRDSVSTQIITQCVEAALSPMMVKLESFQGRVESRIEQLEEKVTCRLENLEGRVSSCLEKLEQLNSSQHPKPSNISPGVWFNKYDQMSENSIPLPSSNGIATPVHHMEVNLKPFAISEKEYEMMEGEDIIC